MTEYLLVVLFLLSCCFFYWFYWAPKRLYDHYHKVLTAKGYKVYAYPFNPFGAPAMQKIINNVDTHKDIHYSFKHELYGYDVVLTNISNHV